jgi:hypothetical protein
MRFLLRILVLFLVVSTALSLVRRTLAVLAPARPDPRLRASGGGRLVKDPVCGTYVPQETAVSAGNEFFCSEECRRKFKL